MTATFHDVNSGSNAAGLNHVVNAPVSLSDGDFLIATIAWNGNPGSISVPGTWQELFPQITGASNPRQNGWYIFWHTGDVTTWTWTIGSSIASGWGCEGYTGVDATTPLDAVTPTTNFDASGSSASAVATGVTTQTANALIVAGAAANSSTTTFTTSDLDERFDTGAGKAETGADRLQAIAGGSGDKTFTISAARAWTTWLASLRSASGGGGGGSTNPADNYPHVILGRGASW